MSKRPWWVGPSFIRYPRGNGLGTPLKKNPTSIEIGKAETIQKGELISFWCIGDIVELAKDVASIIHLECGITVSIVNARFVKPLDEQLLLEHAKRHDVIVSLEDNVLKGGFGSSILETLSDQNILKKVLRFGWPDQFIEHGTSTKYLRSKYGLSSNNIMDQIRNFLPLTPQIDENLKLV